MSDSSIDTKSGRVQVTEKALDHGVDAIAAVGIVAVAYFGIVDPYAIAGLVSIALGKRLLPGSS